MEIPEDFDATGNWNRYLDSLGKIVKMCEETNMRFALEGHANVIVGTTDAMLRAFDWIKSDAFGTNFDTAWQLVQREYLPGLFTSSERRFSMCTFATLTALRFTNCL